MTDYRIVCHYGDRYCDLITASIPDDVSRMDIEIQARQIFWEYYRLFHHLDVDPGDLEIVIHGTRGD